MSSIRATDAPRKEAFSKLKFFVEPVDRRDQNGQTALMLAAQQDDKQKVAYLLSLLFTDVDAADEDGNTPLHYVLERQGNNCGEILHLILAKGARPDVKNNNGVTPLMIAAKNGDERSVDMLLIHKATRKTLNSQDNTGDTALMRAARFNNLHIVERLLEIPGIDLDLKNNLQLSAFRIAQNHGFVRIAMLLSDKGAAVPIVKKKPSRAPASRTYRR